MHRLPPSFRDRISDCSKTKQTNIILAVDPLPRIGLAEFAKKLIILLEQHICAVKVNFHLILPLSSSELAELNDLIHSFGLQSIADIKLNDIPRTNAIAINYLLEMGFDAIIVNPFIGKTALQSAVNQAHTRNGGILTLIYMSHKGADEGFGLSIVKEQKNNDRISKMYNVFLDYSYSSHVDGMIVGANQLHILNEIHFRKEIPIYSPGFGTQGGDIKKAAKSGIDYFIIGSSLIESKDPLQTIGDIQHQISFH